MAKIAKNGGCGMIGGVRSPMAAPKHGLVGSSKLNPHIIGAGRKSMASGTTIRSPQHAKDNV